MISSGNDTERNGNTTNDNAAKAGVTRAKRRGMSQDNFTTTTTRCASESDCNSNNTITLDNSRNTDDPMLSSADLTTNDYRWLLELGSTRDKYPTSIFAMSANMHHDLSYDDLAKNIDANLAEIDMEDFRSEDMHSILALPAMFCGGEQFASVSGSLMLKLDGVGSPNTPCKDSGTSEEDVTSSGDVSMCKSELLFSPVKEAPLMLPSFSVDSLDCESYDEQELMLTCQANKENYTIAFEGSFMQYSEDSDYHDGGDVSETSDQYRLPKAAPKSLQHSMVQSDYAYTTWSKLKRINDANRKRTGQQTRNKPAPKSQSLPNLLRNSMCASEIRLSQLNVSLDSDQCVPVYDVHASHSRSGSSTSSQSFSLVRLFIQQKTHTPSLQSSLEGSLYSNFSDVGCPVRSNSRNGSRNPNLCSEKVADKSFGAKKMVGEVVGRVDGGQLVDSLMEKVVNKSNGCQVDGRNEDWTNDLNPESATHATQTKLGNKGSKTDPYAGVLNNARGDGSPVCRRRLTTPGFINNASGEKNERRQNVTIAAMKNVGTQIPVHVTDQGVQTSVVETDEKDISQDTLTGSDKKAVYICYPNYSLPDLSFLRTSTSQNASQASSHNASPVYVLGKREPRPRSCPDVGSVRQRNFRHVKDWESLNILLPREVRHFLGQGDTEPDPATDVPKFCSEKKTTQVTGTLPPPLPKRSISLPGKPQRGSRRDEESQGPTRGILRRPSPSRSDSDPNSGSSEPVPCNSSIILTGSEKNCRPRSKLSSFLAANEPLTDACSLAALLPMVSFSPDDSSSTGTLDFDRYDDGCCPGSCCSCEKRNGKKVSFSERVCVRETCTPEGSPEVRGSHVCCRKNEGEVKSGSPVSEDGDGESPPFEFSVSPPTGTSPSDVPSDVPSTGEVGVDYSHKRSLILAVNRATNILVSHFGQTKDSQEKYQLGCTTLTPVCGHKVLEFLCPALHNLLADGLQPQLYSYFGCIQNSLWRVVEASIQQGTSSRAIIDLVTRLNSEDFFKDVTSKFNAFLLGLLNIRSVDSWVAYLCSQHALIRKYYQPNSFIDVCTSSSRPLLDELLAALQPLSTLPFELDLLFEPTNHYAKNDTQQGIGKQTKDYKNQQAREGQRPKSCIDHTNTVMAGERSRKRWSDYEDSDSRPPAHPRPKPEGAAATRDRPVPVFQNGGDEDDNIEFKMLQRKWEALSAKEFKQPEVAQTSNNSSVVSTSGSKMAGGSRIPRLVKAEVEVVRRRGGGGGSGSGVGRPVSADLSGASPRKRVLPPSRANSVPGPINVGKLSASSAKRPASPGKCKSSLPRKAVGRREEEIQRRK